MGRLFKYFVALSWLRKIFFVVGSSVKFLNSSRGSGEIKGTFVCRLVDRLTFAVDTSFVSLLNGVFGLVASSKSILLLMTVAEVFRVVVRFFLGRFVVLENSSLLSTKFVLSVVVEGLGLAVIRTDDSDPKSTLAIGFCEVTATCSLKPDPTKFVLGKSPSLWNGSRSTQGDRSIGARLPDPHR